MAARLASESSVVTRDCNTGLRSEHKIACEVKKTYSDILKRQALKQSISDSTTNTMFNLLQLLTYY